jgi:hypothetical protein
MVSGPSCTILNLCVCQAIAYLANTLAAYLRKPDYSISLFLPVSLLSNLKIFNLAKSGYTDLIVLGNIK